MIALLRVTSGLDPFGIEVDDIYCCLMLTFTLLIGLSTGIHLIVVIWIYDKMNQLKVLMQFSRVKPFF